VEHEGKVLLARRAIEPCVGKWGLPAGYMEVGESTAGGAARETLEEAGAAVDIVAPFAHVDIPVIGQTYVIYRARLAPGATVRAGPETQEVGLFDPGAFPEEDLAFSSTALCLQWYCEDVRAGTFHVHHATIEKRGPLGGGPGTFEVTSHMRAVPVPP